MEIVNKNFNEFLENMKIERYKIVYYRPKNKSYIYVKTLGLNSIGMKEIFAISRSRYLSDASLLINLLVRRMMDTNQKEGIRKDLIRHPKEGYQLRYVLKQSKEEPETLLVIGPDENNHLPGEDGYKEYL